MDELDIPNPLALAAAGAAAAGGAAASAARKIKASDKADDSIGELSASGGDSSRPFESEDSEREGAEICPDFFVRVRKVVLNADGSPSLLVKLLPLLTLLFFLSACATVNQRVSSWTAPNLFDVLWIVLAITGTVMLVAFVQSLPTLTAVLRPVDGELDMLGAGRADITAVDLAALNTQRRVTRGLQALCWFMGVIMIITSVNWTVKGIGGEGTKIARVPSFLTGAVLLMTLLPLFCEFNLSLQVAAQLASNDVLKVVKAARQVSPAEPEEWEARVVQPALALHDGAVALLSQGWAYGLVMSFIGLWTASLGILAGVSTLLSFVMTAPTVFRLVGLLMLLVLLLLVLSMPLLMSGAVAGVSTSCDELGNAINTRRIEDLDSGPRLMQLELALQNLNAMQGLGFVIADTVLDKKKLRAIYGAVIGAFATIIPVMISFNAGSTGGIVYGAFADSPTVYAYSAVTRPYGEGISFCESLWMFPATFDPALISTEQIIAIVDVMVGGSGTAYVGAEKDVDGVYHWSDGTPWTLSTEGIADMDDPTEQYLYLTLDADTGELEWKGTKNPKGMICQADLANIKGAIPPILNLAKTKPPERTWCDLSRAHKDAIRSISLAFGNHSSCVYNMSLSSIIEN
jgi:hypothetical protein